MISKFYFLIFSVLVSFPVFSAEPIDLPVDEFEFIKTIKGKDKVFVEEALGEPSSKKIRENEGGIVEFWVYEDIVKIAGKESVYKYTQVGIVNNAVETVGNTNLKSE